MTSEQQAAFIMAQAASAMAEIAGMQAENTIYQTRYGGNVRYGQADFVGVIDRYGISHNAVLSFFQG